MKLNLNCQEVSRLISAREDETLPPSERARFRLHLVMCANCRNVDEQMRFLRQAMRGLSGGLQGKGPAPSGEAESD
jgi:Putative zinc-finger